MTRRSGYSNPPRTDGRNAPSLRWPIRISHSNSSSYVPPVGGGRLIKAGAILLPARSTQPKTPVQLPPIRQDHDCRAGAIAGSFLQLPYAIFDMAYDSVFDDDGLRQFVVPTLSSTVPQHPYNSQPEEQKGEHVSDNVAQHGGLIIYGAAVNSHHTNAYKAFAETLTASHVEIDVIEKDHDGSHQITENHDGGRGRCRPPALFDINSQHQSQGGG